MRFDKFVRYTYTTTSELKIKEDYKYTVAHGEYDSDSGYIIVNGKYI